MNDSLIDPTAPSFFPLFVVDLSDGSMVEYLVGPRTGFILRCEISAERTLVNTWCHLDPAQNQVALKQEEEAATDIIEQGSETELNIFRNKKLFPRIFKFS